MRFAQVRGPVGATAAAFVLLLAAYVAGFDGDLSALVCVDERRIGEAPFEHVTTGFAKNGYDGQFYYALARDPWTSRAGDIDGPTRHLRILYPAIAWAITGGDGQRLFWALPLVNLLATLGLAWLGVILAVHFGRSAWWGMLLPVAVNAYMPALRNLTDPLSLFAVTALLTGRIRGWSWFTMLLCGLAAVLSREQNVLVVGILVVSGLCTRRRSLAINSSASLLAWGSWVAILYFGYGELPFHRSGGIVGWPFAGMLEHYGTLDALGSTTLRAVHIFGMGFIVLQVLAGLWLAPRKGDSVVTSVLLVGVALAVCGGAVIYGSPWSFMRVYAWMPLGVWILGVQTGRLTPVVLMAPAASWPLMMVAQAWTNH